MPALRASSSVALAVALVLVGAGFFGVAAAGCGRVE